MAGVSERLLASVISGVAFAVMPLKFLYEEGASFLPHQEFLLVDEHLWSLYMLGIHKMTINEQVAYLLQGTEYDDDAFKELVTDDLLQRLVLAEHENYSMRVYYVLDPFICNLHLGHTVPIHKLRQLQELGHEVHLIVDNFFAPLIDWSVNKDNLHLQPNLEQIQVNTLSHIKQANTILDPFKTHIHYNSEWLSVLSFANIINLASDFTIQQFLDWEYFKQRWNRGEPIYLHETFYTLMEVYNVKAIQADIKIVRADKFFKAFAMNRKATTFGDQKPIIPLIYGTLPGTDGVMKMSNRLGNYISLSATPEDMYGKVMSIPDHAMGKFFRLVTRWTPEKIATIEKDLDKGHLHPRDAKMKLAREIVSICYSEEMASTAEIAFIRVFQQRETPIEIPEYVLQIGESVLEVLVNSNLVASKSEGRRMLAQRGVRLDNETLNNPAQIFPHPGILQIGKRLYLRVKY